MAARFKRGDIVSLAISITRQLRRDTALRVTLDAGQQFQVAAVGEYAGSPEYTLRDENADEWPDVPESALLPVTDSRPRSLWE